MYVFNIYMFCQCISDVVTAKAGTPSISYSYEGPDRVGNKGQEQAALKDEFLASAIFYSGTLADEKHHIICFDSNVS